MKGNDRFFNINANLMILQDIQNKIYSLTGTDSTSYTNANMLIDINLWYQKVVGMILDSQDEVDFDDQRNTTTFPIKTILMTTNRDYSIPVSEKMLKFKDLSVSYDGSILYKATPINSNELSIAMAVPSSDSSADTTLDGFFSRTSPRYSVRFNSIFIYPRALSADVSAGAFMIAEWYRQATEFTSSDLTAGTAVPGFDDTFHPILAYGPSMEYCLSKQLPQLIGPTGIAATLQDYEARLRRQYSIKQNDRKYALNSDYQNYK